MMDRTKKGFDFVITDEEGNSFVVEGSAKKKSNKTLIKSLFLSKKCNSDLVDKITKRKLDVEQLKQIKNGYKSGLSDSQLESLVNSNRTAEEMAEIVEIAVLVNSRE